MRRATFGIALLTVILAGCLIHLHVLERCVDRSAGALANARTLALAGSYDAAEAAAQRAWENWDHARVFLGSVLRHSESDELGCTFARLPDYADADGAAEFCASCAELIARLSHILDTERAKLYNIL